MFYFVCILETELEIKCILVTCTVFIEMSDEKWCQHVHMCTSQFHIIVTPINHSAKDNLVCESYIAVHGYSVQNSLAICLYGFESTDSCASV
jgi:hypothetical protein